MFVFSVHPNLYYHLYLYLYLSLYLYKSLHSASVGATVASPEKVETICGSTECLPNGTLLDEMRMQQIQSGKMHKNIVANKTKSFKPKI